MARIAKWGAWAVAALVFLAPVGVSAQTYSVDQLSDLPQVKSPQQAARIIQREYPSSLQSNGIGGRVQLRFVVDAEGKVDPSSVEVVAASVKALGDAAVKAVARIEFVPGKKDGANVASVVLMPITFGVS